MLERKTNNSLNSAQTTALEKLTSHGLTEAHLLGCEWFTTHTHMHALGYLMIAKHYPASNAIKELENLNSDQLIGLMIGTPKKDLLGLSVYQIRALQQLASWGLTSNMLRNKEWFNSKLHFNVLIKLIREEFIKPETALHDMADLNIEQLATLLHHNLSIDELRGLSKWELIALCELKDQGLTHQHIKNKTWLNSQAHINALIMLVNNQGWTPEKALSEIEYLKEEQLDLICRGFPREDIIQLTPIQASFFLMNNAGTPLSSLKPSHLIGKSWLNSTNHYLALLSLTANDNFTLESALAEIDGLNEDQVALLQIGLKRSDVLGMEKFQLNALFKLKHKQLKPEHLRDKPWFNSQAHVDALAEMLDSPPYLSIDDALRMLENSDENMANTILNRHVNFPYDEKIEKFTVFYYTKVLIDILNRANDLDLEEFVQEMKNELDKVFASFQASSLPQHMRKEIAASIIQEVHDNEKLSVSSKSSLLIAASEHNLFGHLNSISYGVNYVGGMFSKRQWHSNTQKMLIHAAKDMNKNMSDESYSATEEDSLSPI